MSAGPARCYPLVLYSHASNGNRRQSSFRATHLATHGYIVAAVDHTGSTAADWPARAERIAARRPLRPEESAVYLRRIIADRVPDLRLLLDELHGDFSDHVGDETACSREHAHDFTRTVGLAHFDASLKGEPAAISQWAEASAGGF